MGKATAKCVAEHVGYSVSTVSKVLRGEGAAYRIRPEVARRILDAADSLGYAPDHLARSLKRGRTGLVAIVGATASFPVREMRQHAAARAVTASGYRAHLFELAWASGRTAEWLHDVMSLRPEGILASEAVFPELIDGLRAIQARGTPVVGMDYAEGLEIDQVYIDRERSGYLAAYHLASLGHRRIGYVISKGDGWYISERVKGFRRALDEAGISHDDGQVVHFTKVGDYYRTGYELAKGGLLAPGRFTGLAFLSDPLAIGAMRACAEEGVRVPHDISLVGAEGLPGIEYLPIPLTSVAWPVQDVAKRAVEFLVERIRGYDGSARVEKVQPRLDVRASSAPPGGTRGAASGAPGHAVPASVDGR